MGPIVGHPGFATSSYAAISERTPSRRSILPFAPFKLFEVDRFAKSLKCVGKAERVGPQIFIDVSFDQDMAMKTL